MATIEELTRALRNADKAGDVKAAKRFADEIRKMRGSGEGDPDLRRDAGHNVPEFDPKVPGYNPETGDVEHTGPSAKAAAFATSAVEGVPVAGPLLRKGATALAAGAVAPFSDRDFGEVYQDLDRATTRAQEDNPWTATAGGMAGAVAGTVPLILAAPTIMGAGAGGLASQTLWSALSGTALGTADSAVRSGGDLGETLKGGMTGLGTGIFGPAAGKIVGKGVQTVADAFRRRALAKTAGVDRPALDMLARAAARDGLDEAGAAEALRRLGPDGMPLDLGENMEVTAAALATMPGEARSIMRGAIKARDAGANSRIRGEIDAQLGPAPVPSAVKADIKTNQRALSPYYREALREASPVDTSRVAKYLDQEIQTLRGDAQRGVQKIRTMLNRVGSNDLETSPAVLLETRHAVDDMLETAQGSHLVDTLSTARQAIDDQLRASVPNIKEVDARFAELARQRTAVDRGQQVLASGREAPRPTELADEMQQGALPQGEQVGPSAVPVRLRQGGRAEIERLVGTTANDRVALQRAVKGEGDWNRDRLATLFGQDKADNLVNLVERERKFADTSNLVTRNSETGSRMAAMADLRGDNAVDLGIEQGFIAGGFSGAARGAATKGVKEVANALRNRTSEASRAQMAKALTSGQQKVLDAMIKAGRKARLPQSQIDQMTRALLIGGGMSVGRP